MKGRLSRGAGEWGSPPPTGRLPLDGALTSYRGENPASPLRQKSLQRTRRPHRTRRRTATLGADEGCTGRWIGPERARARRQASNARGADDAPEASFCAVRIRSVVAAAVVVLSTGAALAPTARAVSPADVDPFIGTAGKGVVTPGPQLPFGFANPGP